mgnify:CR=1 FL=1
MRHSLLALMFIGFAMPANALAEDTISGEEIFKTRCKVCHNALTHQRKIGPGLKGVYGREAESGIGTLTEERINQWLQNPKALKPNTRMPKYGQMQDPLQRQAVIEYLKTL